MPLEPVHGWDACFEFSRAIASDLARALARAFTTNFGKAARTGKILIDCKRNHRAAVAIAAYSTRARPNASVSVPIRWEDAASVTRGDGATVVDLREALAGGGGDPWHDYWDCRQRLPASRSHRKA